MLYQDIYHFLKLFLLPCDPTIVQIPAIDVQVQSDLYEAALTVASMLDLSESIFSVIFRLEGVLAMWEDKDEEVLIRQILAYFSVSACLELFSWQSITSKEQQESLNRKTFSAKELTTDI